MHIGRRRWPVVLLAVFVIFVLPSVYWWVRLSTVQTSYFLERVGHIIQANADPHSPLDRVGESVELTSSTGLAVKLRTSRPPDVVGARYPVILIIGGRRTGKDAVDLVGRGDKLAFVAIDYPYDGQDDIRGIGQSLRVVPDVQQAFLDTPPALMLVRSWIEQQHWADPSRIEIVGVSLGVPFAAVAGSLDDGFARIWLIHGGGDNISWIEYALRRHVDSDLMRRAVASLLHLLMYGNSFDTSLWVRESAPRSVVLIAARDDERVPLASIQALEDLAVEEHVNLLWTPGQHVGPGRTEVLQQLIRIVIDGVCRAAANDGATTSDCH